MLMKLEDYAVRSGFPNAKMLISTLANTANTIALMICRDYAGGTWVFKVSVSEVSDVLSISLQDSPVDAFPVKNNRIQDMSHLNTQDFSDLVSSYLNQYLLEQTCEVESELAEKLSELFFNSYHAINRGCSDVVSQVID